MAGWELRPENVDQLYPAIPTILPDSGAATHHPFVPLVVRFVDCVLSGEESHCNIADTVKTHEICIAAEMANTKGKPVKLPLP